MGSSDRLRIGVLQYAISENPEDNLATISRLLDELDASRPDLVLLPEVCLTGFGLGANAPAFTEDSEEIQTLLQLAKKHHFTLLAGVRMQLDDHRRNRAMLIDPEGVRLRYDKQVLFSYWNEHKLFQAGDKSETFSLGNWTVAPFICYELRFPELFRRTLGAELMVVIANWPSERRHHWLTLLRARAIENQAYVVGVNRIGSSKKVTFVGDSIVFDPYGSTIKELGNEEAVLVQDLDLSVVRDYRKAFPAIKDVKYL